MSIAVEKPTNVRYGVLGFACVLSMVTYLDRVCFGTVAPFVKLEFGLDDDQVGSIFTAFTLAYAAFEVPTGWLGDVFGPRKTLIRIVLWWSLFTALTGLIYPSAMAFFFMLAVRFLFGIGEAGAYPNIARAFHNWFPFQERGFAKGTVWMAGRFAGGITPFVVLAMLIETPGTDGAPAVTHWRHIFWVFGAIGVVWCIGFWFWFRDRPEESPHVNKAELALIHAGDSHFQPAAVPLAEPPVFQADDPKLAASISAGAPKIVPLPVPTKHERIKVPWGKLITSPNLWLLCGMYFCASFGWYFNITYMPGYLQTQFKAYFTAERTVKWSAEWWEFSIMLGLPLLAGSLACIVGGYLTDLFIKKTGNRKWGRRLFGILGHGVCAVFYFLSMTTSDAWMFVICIALASFWNDITMGAAWASCIDIGRRYSGIVSGCMNTIGNLGGAVANKSTGLILFYYTQGIDQKMHPDEYFQASQPAWFINFLLFGGVYVIAAFLWMGFDATKPIEPEPGEPGA